MNLRALASSLLLAGLVLCARQPVLFNYEAARAQFASSPVAASLPSQSPSQSPGTAPLPALFGFRDFATQARWDEEFLAVPDAKLAAEHLKTLTAAPHWASSPEDYATALYVADRFKAAGLETEIVPYSVLLSKPESLLVEAFDATGKKIFSGPTPNPSDDPRVLPGFNSGSPSGDVTAPVVYANYGRLADFQRLSRLGIGVRGKIVLVRYGEDFRGVKVYIAQQYGAKGVLLYSDPSDDGARRGQTYPDGPWRPNSAVQLGSVQFLPIYPGDPTTPDIASAPGLPQSQRIPTDKLQYDLPSIPVEPLSAADAAQILRALAGPSVPRGWQGGLGFAYRVGGSGAEPVSVHMRLALDTRLRTIWDVIGKIPGTSEPEQWVIAGNHRDAWNYGAADPGSGTAAMLEAVHGLGVLLKQGWRPRRTIVVASWDGEEEGLIGSTEWVEQHAAELAHAVAYFNVDVAASGPNFSAGAVPSLREFLREIAQDVPSPAGGTVFDRWKREGEGKLPSPGGDGLDLQRPNRNPQIADLGSGSDYTPFLQHEGVPSTDIGSEGPFGVYHTVDDNYDWFVRFADPAFAYTQQQARFFGLEILHMADADVLPLDYEAYAQQIRTYLEQAHRRADGRRMKLDFVAAENAASKLVSAAHAVRELQRSPPANATTLNRTLASVERALLIPEGLPRRPWYRHSTFAPGEFTGYAAVVLPGVNEGIDALDGPRTQSQLSALAATLDRATSVLAAATH